VLEVGLEKLAKPLFRLRAIDVFRVLLRADQVID